MKTRAICLAIVVVLAAIAIRVSLAAKPYTPIVIDQHTSGAWLNYAAATAVPTQPDLVCMYVFVPGQVAGAPKQIVRT